MKIMKKDVELYNYNKFLNINHVNVLNTIYIYIIKKKVSF